MTKEEALKIISDGHSIISGYLASEICQLLGVPSPTKLIQNWTSSQGKGKYSLTMKEGYEETNGIYTLALSEYIAEKLGVKEKASSFNGRGSQARAYAKEVEKVIL